jgi:hypothetical protein
MILFCLLWIPLVYLLRRSLTDEGGAGGVWALLLGSAAAVSRFLFGGLVDPGGFGFSRWVSGFVDVVSLPTLVPLAVYLLCILFKVFSGNPDFAGFTLLWCIPVAALRAVSWSSPGGPVLLVLAPLLWTALALGIPFFAGLMMSYARWYVLIPCSLCVLALPLVAATAWWAFFSQRPLLGLPFLAAALIPAVVSLVFDFIRAG